MRLGVATKDDLLLYADALLTAGFDYLELSLMAVEGLTENQYRNLRKRCKDSALQIEIFQSMIPASYSLTGERADLEKTKEYLLRALDRAADLGGKLMVFGSAGARRRPEEWTKENAVGQLVEFVQMACEMLQTYEMKLGIEQIAPFETNMINTLWEAEEICRRSGEINVGLVVDLAHMMYNGIEPEEILRVKTPILHAHIAKPDGRLAPLAEDGCDALYRRFIRALSEKEGVRTISVETGGTHGVSALEANAVGRYLKAITA